MKVFTYSLFFIISLIVISSCNKSPEGLERAFLEKKIEKNRLIVKDKKWVVVLPGLGCTGCIQEGEVFMINNIDHINVLFILTNVESIKLFQQKTGVKIEDHANIYVDKNNDFELISDNILYPVIIEMENNKLKNYEFQSPANGMAFSKLSDKLIKL